MKTTFLRTSPKRFINWYFGGSDQDQEKQKIAFADQIIEDLKRNKRISEIDLCDLMNNVEMDVYPLHLCYGFETIDPDVYAGDVYQNNFAICIADYPFNEGDDYYTIDGMDIIRSTWDEESEAIHFENKLYFSDQKSAVLYGNGKLTVKG